MHKDCNDCFLNTEQMQENCDYLSSNSSMHIVTQKLNVCKNKSDLLQLRYAMCINVCIWSAMAQMRHNKNDERFYEQMVSDQSMR